MLSSRYRKLETSGITLTEKGVLVLDFNKDGDNVRRILKFRLYGYYI